MRRRELARPDEILVSQSVIDLCADRDAFEDRGPLTLKGFATPQPAAAVSWQSIRRSAG